MIERIQQILKAKNLTAAQLADQLQVNRSGMSHILSGRNKPSLDFITKLLTSYPEINSDWLLRGKGKMTGENPVEVEREKNVEQTLFEKGRSEDIQKAIIEKPQKPETRKVENPQQKSQTVNKRIKKIIFVYEDDSFREIDPE